MREKEKKTQLKGLKREVREKGKSSFFWGKATSTGEKWGTPS